MRVIGARLAAGTGLAVMGFSLSSVPGHPAGAVNGSAGNAVSQVSVASTHTRSLTARVLLRLTPAAVAPTPPRSVLGSGAFDFSTGIGQATLHPPGLTENVVFQPTSVFVRERPRQANALPPGKEWISAGLTEFPVLSVNFPLFVLQTEASNPSFLIDEVAWGAVSATPLGPQTVAGAPADSYRVRVSPMLAASHASGPAAPGFSRAVAYELQALGESGPGAGSSSVTQAMTVWVRNGMVVQLAASPGSGQGTTTVTLTDVGVRVTATAPPRSKIVDLASLVPGGERESNGGGDSDGA